MEESAKILNADGLLRRDVDTPLGVVHLVGFWMSGPHRPKIFEILSEASGLKITADDLRQSEENPRPTFPRLNFDVNWTHSGGFCVLAYGDPLSAMEGASDIQVPFRIGVDLERILPRRLHLADRFYSQEEVDWLRKLDGGELGISGDVPRVQGASGAVPLGPRTSVDSARCPSSSVNNSRVQGASDEVPLGQRTSDDSARCPSSSGHLSAEGPNSQISSGAVPLGPRTSVDSARCPGPLGEVPAVSSAGHSPRIQEFFRLWCRKEALYKCVGGTFFEGAIGRNVLPDSVMAGPTGHCREVHFVDLDGGTFTACATDSDYIANSDDLGESCAVKSGNRGESCSAEPASRRCYRPLSQNVTAVAEPSFGSEVACGRKQRADGFPSALCIAVSACI